MAEERENVWELGLRKKQKEDFTVNILFRLRKEGK